MDPPPAKRSRITPHRGADDYRPGSIVEIEVHNFMTYSHIKSQPGPRLNLVIGPNGTGKSSLVCAIGICLAGEPQLLGRATQIGDFVKRGEDAGWVKISLRGDSPGEVLAITRKINKRNKSEWLCNDYSVTKKEIQEKLRKYNIQLNNLTQFLPQDRVCEFAKLTPVQLLEETEKAVGNPELSAQHQTLIQRNLDRKKIQIALSIHEASLAHNKASNAEIEQDEQRMRLRNKLKEKASIMAKKLPWLKYEEKKVTFERTKAAENDAKSRLQNVRGRNKELKAPLEALKARKDEAKRAGEMLQEMRTANERKLRQFPDLETELAAKVRSILCEIQDVHRKEIMRQGKIDKARYDVGVAEEELANQPVPEHPQAILNTLGSQIHDLNMEVVEKKSLIRDKEAVFSQRRNAHDQCNRRLQDIDTVNTRLLQALKNSGAHHIVNAYEWVQSHRDQFKGAVFGPVLLEVRIQNKEHATYVENHVPGHIWKAFITQDVEDRDLLVRNLRQFEVPVINQRHSQPRSSPPVTPEMRQLGITTRLDEVIAAPQVVKNVLIGQAGLDNSFIGTSETNNRADEAPRLGVRDLWTPENHYRWQESRYGGHISASINPVRPVRLFSENVDLREKNELENRKSLLNEEMSLLEHEIRDYNMRVRALDDEAANLHRQREEINNQRRSEMKRLQEMKNIIEQRKKKLKFLENEEGSADAENRLRAEIEAINDKRVKNVIDLKELLTKAGETHMNYAAQHLNAIELDAMVKEMDKNLQVQELELADAEQKWCHCKEATENCKSQLARAKDLANQTANLTTDLQSKFAEMPDSVHELEDAIAECQAEAAGLICNNENAIKIYEERCEQIRHLTVKVEENRSALDSCLKDIEKTQSLWLPRLRELVTNINLTFSQNFMEMAVAGEVSLDEHGTDFHEYGILIKVKFRESGDLQVLSAHHQSGGERSVSTILYLVSLQDLTYCPFRVVDEINQGMDPVNERKMFQQLVRAASQPNTPQCFLLTPKLLPDLEYSEACTILNIMNGPWVQEASSSRWSEGVSWSVMSQLIPSQ